MSYPIVLVLVLVLDLLDPDPNQSDYEYDYEYEHEHERSREGIHTSLCLENFLHFHRFRVNRRFMTTAPKIAPSP